METQITESFQTAVAGEFDVIVCGAGPAGVGAAIGAAHRGCKVLLVEKYGFAGGMWTAGLINPVFDYQNKSGIMEEIVDNLKKEGQWGGFLDSCFDYESMKLFLDRLLCEAGVTVLYHTLAVRAICDGKVMRGIITESKDGRRAYLAKTVIDCTGDGDIAAQAGAEFVVGREPDRKTQPMTLMFVLGNIRYMQNDAHELYRWMKQAVEESGSDYSIPFRIPVIIQLPNCDRAVVQLTHVRGVSGLSAADLTKAEMEARKQVADTVRFFKKHIPQLRDVELIYTASQIGVRETRRILGEYVLTKEDLLEGRTFDDSVATVSTCIDIHSPDDIEQHIIPIKPTQIPYRCLIVKGFEGLLTAGRCISGTYDALAAYRVTGDCVALGEAAGRAAAEAVQKNIGLRDIQISNLH